MYTKDINDKTKGKKKKQQQKTSQPFYKDDVINENNTK